MRVKLLSTIAGPALSAQAGEEVDLPEEEARGLIQAGAAELVRHVEPEAALEKPVERAVQRRRGASRSISGG